MTSILLVAALAAGPDSLPPPSTPSVVRDTVYIERVTTERAINPQAGITAEAPKSKAAQIGLGIGLAAVGTYLVIHGSDNPNYELERQAGGYDLEKRTNKEVYIGIGLATLGLITVFL